MQRFLLSVAVASSLLAVLAGCGAGAEREEIAGVLRAGWTSDDPRVVCEGSLAPALLNRIYGGTAQCHETESKDSERVSQAQSVDVSAIAVDGRRATAVVTIHGGHHDGARGALRLREQREGWRVTDLSVGLLRSQFEASLRRLQTLDASIRTCVVLRMRDLSDADFRQIAYGDGVAARKRLGVIARNCVAKIAAANSVVM